MRLLLLFGAASMILVQPDLVRQSESFSTFCLMVLRRIGQNIQVPFNKPFASKGGISLPHGAVGVCVGEPHWESEGGFFTAV